MADDDEMTSQEDAALLTAIARIAMEDGALIAASELTDREVRALWTRETLGCGRIES